MTRLFLIIAAIGALVVGALQLSAQTQSSGWTAYDEAEFMMAQKKGRTIVLAAQAQPCIGCAVESGQLGEVFTPRADTSVLYVAIDSDEQPEIMERHAIAGRSAVVVFEGMREVARVER